MRDSKQIVSQHHESSLQRIFLFQIIEHVHQRDVTRELVSAKVSSTKAFEWLSQMRFYFDPKQKAVLQQLSIHMANAKFNYGFEYLGVQDKLVQTPLTDRCYLTMTQALEGRLGGSPFGKIQYSSCSVTDKVAVIAWRILELNSFYASCQRSNKQTCSELIPITVLESPIIYENV